MRHQPERTAQFLVDKGYVQSREYALQTLSDVSYRKWRDYNPEDSVRFFALRLHDVGMVKSSPQKLIGAGYRLAVSERAEEGAEGIES